jgi:hypothetical protein
MVKKTGKFVIDSLGIGIVGSQLSSATGVTAGSTMTSKFLEGTSKIPQPVLKVKGTKMVFDSVSSLKKGSKKLLKGGSL